MGMLANYIDIANSYRQVDFVVVYIEEAHPTDGWMYSAVEHKIQQHVELEERIVAAEKLDQILKDKHPEFEMPIFVDTISNEASLMFGALPERLAIVVDGKVKFIGGKGPEDYSLADLTTALRKLVE